MVLIIPRLAEMYVLSEAERDAIACLHVTLARAGVPASVRHSTSRHMHHVYAALCMKRAAFFPAISNDEIALRPGYWLDFFIRAGRMTVLYQYLPAIDIDS